MRWLTFSGALRAGADSDRGVPLVSLSEAVADSRVALPSRNGAQLAAVARQARRLVTRLVAAGTGLAGTGVSFL